MTGSEVSWTVAGGGSGLGGCGDDHDPAERPDDLIGPRPVPRQAEASASAATVTRPATLRVVTPPHLGHD